MPELPEVETVCRGLNALTLGQEIRGGEVLLQRTLAYPFSVAEFWQGLEGTAIAYWDRRGKYLSARLSPGGWLGVHLRMSGQLFYLNQDTPVHKHTRIRLFLGDNQELRFVDTRTFGKMWWVPPTEVPEKIIPGLLKLGPEPFSPEFSVEYIKEKIQKSKRKMKNLLLAQEFVAGIGNIYADEVLFKSGINPEAIASDLTEKQIDLLHKAIREVLQTAIDFGGTTFSDFLNVMGVNGNYGGVAWVYGRTGQPCRVCATPITRIKLGGRSSHFCPQCQSNVQLL
ncbi:MAG: DNA-formamidopyrimidine glycosylase [Gomphosphaeria aponina SAG 52.96 = DSM 107014]|uniref:Formamidopyrimidine-DNA glycosylase n=1 Tax=Gomphosphaeria aponina SAG 52.96 = DSM 107014 TaxID=1521640 RepID=A0A941GUZ8_9CHRO|nr:DNA-formamidopyrimidine glycosylase [Gomphosphaeria aponina SAG 52.96 = DSM 107014]